MAKNETAKPNVIVNSARAELVDIHFKMPRFMEIEGQKIDWSEVPTASLFPLVIPAAIRTTLMNAFHGPGKNATKEEKRAILGKKIAAWKAGEANVRERGESETTAWRDAYVAQCMATGMSEKAVKKAIADLITERLGADAKATFSNFIDARALEVAEGGKMTADEAREALEAHFTAMAAEREEKLRAAGAKVKLPDIDLSAFVKKG